MRYRARVLPAVIGVLILAACNSSGLPLAPTQTPSASSDLVPTIEATATSPAVSRLPSATIPPKSLPPTSAPGLQPTTKATLAPTGKATAEPTVQPGATSQAGITVQPVPGDLDQEVLLVEQQASKVRGLKPKTDVPETFLNSAQMHDNLVKDLTENYSPAEAKQDAVELWLLRLLNDPTTDLFQLQVDLLSEQVLGYYDPKKKDLFVLRNQKDLSLTSRQTLAHEFTHALQDEYFDLEKLLPDHSKDDDRSMAIRSLVEGDATMSGLTYARTYFTPEEIQQFILENSSAPSTVLDKAPAYIRESLYFPYSAGPTFVNRLLDQNGFKSVDKALADPPTSTEQIMHPDKYLNTPRDVPVPVSLTPLTDTLGAGWTMQDEGTLGEFDLQEMLKENNDPNAERDAAGWGGGGYAFYQNGDKSLMYIKTFWDTQKDADEFRAGLEATFKGAKKDGDYWVQGGRYFAMQDSARSVTLFSSTDRDTVDRAGK